MKYVVSRLQIDAHVDDLTLEEKAAAEEAGVAENGAVEGVTFTTFAELFDAASPTSNGEKALVAGYWLQVCEGAEGFDSQSANKELKHLGHGLPNITAALETLKKTKPSLVLQLQKSGKTQQARKKYKVTVAGLKKVEEMVKR